MTDASNDVRAHAPGPGRPYGALAVTVGVGAVAWLAGRVPLPFLVDTTLRHTAAGRLLGLGLMPFVSGFIVVEVAALIVPAWRRWRIGGPEGRRRLGRIALWLSLVLAVVQAAGILSYLRTTGRITPDLVSAVAVGVTLVAGTFFLLALTEIVSRFGLGDGFSVVIAAYLVAAAIPVVWRAGNLLHLGVVTPAGLLVVLALFAVVVLDTVWTLASLPQHLPGDGEAPIVIPRPASGIVPVSQASVLAAFAASAYAWVPWLGHVANRLNPVNRSGQVFVLAVIAALGAIEGFLFNRPDLVARVWQRCRGVDKHEAYRAAAGRLLVGGLAHTVVFLLLVQVVFYMAIARSPIFLVLGASGLVVLTAVVGDLVREFRFRARHGGIARVWPVHRTYAVAPLVEALATAGIPCLPRGLWLRCLYQFFGPYIPVTLLVPETDAGDARQVLDAILVSGDPARALERDA